ncbi:MAG TPA: hypothetical protein ENJ95_16740 [Bacteroidetes bacterium]|nr:hypothetical protein [Bacteroidota bacterium]
MDVQSAKLEIINLVLETDDLHLLLKAKNLLVTSFAKNKDEEIVGSHPDGRPMTRKELWESIKQSEKAIEKGDVISQEELVRISENW